MVSYQGYSTHVAWLHGAADIGEAKLWYDRAKKRFYLLVALTIETENPTPTVQCHLVGVDVGSRYLATVATLEGGAQSIPERSYVTERTTTLVCRSVFSDKALAPPPGVASPSASERDG